MPMGRTRGRRRKPVRGRIDNGGSRTRKRSRGNNRRSRRRSEILEIELDGETFEKFDDVAYDEGVEPEELMTMLVDATVYGDRNVSIDSRDRIFFNKRRR